MDKRLLKQATLLLMGFLMFSFGVFAVTRYLRVPTGGEINLMGNLVADPSNFSWGNVALKVPVTRSVNLTNTGNATITKLNLTYVQTTTILINYTVSWNLEGWSINPSETLKANFTLTVYNATKGSFALELYIGGEP